MSEGKRISKTPLLVTAGLAACGAAVAFPLIRAMIGKRRDARGFTIWGVTWPGDVRITRLPGRRLAFRLSASGKVTGRLRGTFTFTERGEASLLVGSGANEGTMEVVTDAGSQIAIGFSGQTDLRRVWGGVADTPRRRITG